MSFFKKHGLKSLAGLYAAAIGISIATSGMNCQGKEYKTGRVIGIESNCNRLVQSLKADESYLSKCKSTVLVNTDEGTYTIGLLGETATPLNLQDRVRFVKKSTEYVTSFDQSHQGFLSAYKVEPEQ